MNEHKLLAKWEMNITVKAVFLDSSTFSSKISFEAIEQVAELTTYPVSTAEQVIARASEAQIIITNKVVVDAEMMARLPKLNLICVAATGMNNIDLAAAERIGITVKNVSGYAGTSLAQYVFAQILSHFSQIEKHNQNTKLGKWQQQPIFCLHDSPIVELQDKTLCLVGYGVLAKTVEQVALAFGMKVIIAERKGQSEPRENRVPFVEAITQADVISLHCPLTEDTENLIDRDVLNRMKSTAMLINTARGAVVNSEDLKQALLNKQIALAVLDVLEVEPPPPEHPLLDTRLDNLKLTGHIAWASIEAQQRLIDMLAKNIATAFSNAAE